MRIRAEEFGYGRGLEKYEKGDAEKDCKVKSAQYLHKLIAVKSPGGQPGDEIALECFNFSALPPKSSSYLGPEAIA
jgi:hypothetical protein